MSARTAAPVRVSPSRIVSGARHGDGWKRRNGLVVRFRDDLRHRRHGGRIPDERRLDHSVHVHGNGGRRRRFPVFVLVEFRRRYDRERLFGHAFLYGRGHLLARGHRDGWPRRQPCRADADGKRYGPTGSTRGDGQCAATGRGRRAIGHVHVLRHRRNRTVFVWVDLRRWDYRERFSGEPHLPIGGGDDRDL